MGLLTQLVSLQEENHFNFFIKIIMKTIETPEVINHEISDEKKIQILALIYQHWDDFYTASELASYLEHGFIFGEFWDNEHYKIDEYIALINEVELEKNPPVIEILPIE